VSGSASNLDGIQRLGQRAYLVDLDQDRIGDSAIDPLLQARDVRDEEVVSDQLDLSADVLSQVLPPVPVVFRHPVLDGDDRIPPAPIEVQLCEPRSVEDS